MDYDARMSMSTLIYLLLRVTHVLMAAVWVGATALMVFFVMPSVKQAGPAAGPMMGAMARRGLNGFMGALGGTTVLTGFYLYWRFTGGFDPAISGSRGAMVFGLGGVAGLVSVIIGGAIVGRNMKKMAGLRMKAAALPEGAERATLTQQADAARDRGASGAAVVLVLQLIAIVCMAIGHYV